MRALIRPRMPVTLCVLLAACGGSAETTLDTDNSKGTPGGNTSSPDPSGAPGDSGDAPEADMAPQGEEDGENGEPPQDRDAGAGGTGGSPGGQGGQGAGGMGGAPGGQGGQGAGGMGGNQADDPCAPKGLCAGLEADYQEAVNRAKRCNPNARILQCKVAVYASLGCGPSTGCKVWINSTEEVEPLVDEWNGMGCDSCLRACPRIACRSLTTGTCSPLAQLKLAPATAGAETPEAKKVVPLPALVGECKDQPQRGK